MINLKTYIVLDESGAMHLKNERYFKLYGVHKEDENNYDLVLDTTNLSIEETVNLIQNNNNFILK